MNNKLLLSLAFIMVLVQAKAQVIRCGTDAHQAALEASDPQIKATRLVAQDAMRRLIANNPSYRITGTITIPVVFHILYNTAAQNISNQLLFEQLEVLRDDFNRTNADAVNTRTGFLFVASGAQIDFCLAKQTPAGAATDGIVRVPTTATTLQVNPHTLSPEWDHTRYLNIYVANLSAGVLGYSSLPPGTVGNDHVVVLYSTVGGPNLPGSYIPYHLGRTATHEVGHYFNLIHTFEGGCSGLTANDCATEGDWVCDTPQLANPTSGCPGNNPNTCTETTPYPPPFTYNMVDQYENYMDYTDDNCMNMFTLGQASRMNAAITLFRPLLATSPGCIPVGINEILDPSFVTLAPNPTNGIFHVQFNFPASKTVLFEVSDLAGRTIYKSEYETVMSSNITFDLTDKAEGIYVMKVVTENGYLVKRIVIAR